MTAAFVLANAMLVLPGETRPGSLVVRDVRIAALATGAAVPPGAVDCAGDTLQARITRFSAEALHLCPGMRVFALVKAISLDPGAVA